MNTVVFIGFGDEKQAFEGDRTLREMHKDGSLTLYADAIIAKDSKGNVAIRQPAMAGPFGTVTGLIAGSLVGLLGGPPGVAVGTGVGTLMGAAFDLARWGVDNDAVQVVGDYLTPGKAAVIANVDETWQLPLDTRMEALGGTILRRTPTQVDDIFYERDVKAKQAELADLEAEKVAELKAADTKKSAERNIKLQAKIDAAKRRLQEKQDQLAAQIDSVKTEGEEKVALLKGQMTTANDEAKAQLEKRLAQVHADYRARTEKLTKALQQRQAAHAA